MLNCPNLRASFPVLSGFIIDSNLICTADELELKLRTPELTRDLEAAIEDKDLFGFFS